MNACTRVTMDNKNQFQNGRLKNARKNKLKKIEVKIYKKNEKEIHEKLAK